MNDFQSFMGYGSTYPIEDQREKEPEPELTAYDIARQRMRAHRFEEILSDMNAAYAKGVRL